MIKKQFYYFGSSSGEKTFVLFDPLVISEDNTLDDFWCILNNYDLSKENEKLNSLVEDFSYRRGLLFCSFKNQNNIIKFLNHFHLISPDIVEEDFSISFFDDKKFILVKINKFFKFWKNLRDEIWGFVKPFDLITEDSFMRKTNCWEDSDGIHDREGSDLCFETNKLKLSICYPYYLFLMIKPRNYGKLKLEINKKYKKK